MWIDTEDPENNIEIVQLHPGGAKVGWLITGKGTPPKPLLTQVKYLKQLNLGSPRTIVILDADESAREPHCFAGG